MGMLGGMVGAVAGGVLSAAGYGISRGLDALDDQITSTVGTRKSGYINSDNFGGLRNAGLEDDWAQVAPEDRVTGGSLTNDTDHSIWVKGENSPRMPYEVRSGQTYPYHVDGFADPVAAPNQVYKVVGGNQVRLDIYYTSMRGAPVTLVLPGRSGTEVYLLKLTLQLAGGGWRSTAWAENNAAWWPLMCKAGTCLQ